MRILYLFRATRKVDRSEFCDYVKAYGAEEFPGRAESVVIAVTEPVPPPIHIIPFRHDLAALVSLDGVGEDVLLPEPPRFFAGAYRADAARPVEHKRLWNLGTRTPGIGMLTLFRQKKGLAREEFLTRWFDGHTPLTVQLHPNKGYVRNLILGSYGEDERPAQWDGIVEEQYDPEEDLLKPGRFFGGERYSTIGSMIHVYRDVKGFIDYPSIRTWLTYEYRIKG